MLFRNGESTILFYRHCDPRIGKRKKVFYGSWGLSEKHISGSITGNLMGSLSWERWRDEGLLKLYNSKKKKALSYPTGLLSFLFKISFIEI